MRRTVRPDAMRYRTHFVLPIVALVAACLGGLAFLLISTTRVQDEMARARETELVRAAMAGKVESLRSLLKDYGFWDEAVRNLVLNFDPAFADANMGPHLFNIHGYDYGFVLDGRDRTIYASRGRRRTAQQALTSLGPSFAQAVSRLRVTDAPPDLRIAGFTRVGGRLAIFGVGPIRPSPGSTLNAPPGPASLLVIVDVVDERMLDGIMADYRITGLQLVDEPGRRRASLPLSFLDGGRAAHLSWAPSAPGARSRQLAMPWLIGLGAFTVMLALIALRNARSAANELVASEAKAQHLANHDTLTGLPNRRAFVEQLRLWQGGAEKTALLYLDLDGFKEVNDVFGHEAGDLLLKAATERLHSVVAWRGLLARIGGDEFAIVVRGDAAVDTVQVLATAIVHAFDEPFETAGYSLVVGTSIGVALDAGELTSEELVRRADVAMYTAKAEGKRRVRVYEPAMERGRNLNKQLECELREAIGTEQIRVLFQPIVEAQNGRIVAVEALARWTSRTRGEIPPDVFIPIAESSGLITALGKQILREACRQASRWDVALAVNLSPAQFWDDALFGDVTAILEETGFPAHRLELEITEGYLLRRPEAAAKVLGKLRRLGIQLALDDFGTGYASVGYLKRFRLDKLKLDRSFVERVGQDGEAGTVATAIIALGHALNLSITAEGIETHEQADLLRVAGCTHLQGWLYGKPVPADELTIAPRRESSHA